MLRMNNALGKDIFHRYNKEIILTPYQHCFRLFSIFAQLGGLFLFFFLFFLLQHQQAKRKTSVAK